MSSEEPIDSLEELKAEFPIIYSEIVEQFASAKRRLREFDLDCFTYNIDGQFAVGMSRGILSELETFTMYGEFVDDEIVVYSAEFDTDGASCDGEDLFDVEDSERESYREDDDYDSDY